MRKLLIAYFIMTIKCNVNLILRDDALMNTNKPSIIEL